MKHINEYIHVRSIWRTVTLIVVLALLASPDAPIPFLALYAIVIICALLLPVRAVSNMILTRSLGVVAVGFGGWLAVSSVGSFTESGAFVAVGLVAIALPTVLRRRNRSKSQV